MCTSLVMRMIDGMFDSNLALALLLATLLTKLSFYRNLTQESETNKYLNKYIRLAKKNRLVLTKIINHI